MRELQQIRDSFRQKDADLQSQYQTGDISEDFYRQARAQNAQYLSERLKDQAAFYAESDAQRADWQKGLQEGLSNCGQCIRLRLTGSTACDGGYLRDGE